MTDGACNDLNADAADLGDDTGALAVGDGAIAVEFSPNFESDGTIMIVAVGQDLS